MMRSIALLFLLCGCSTGNAYVVTDPPLTRVPSVDPVEAAKPDMVALSEANIAAAIEAYRAETEANDPESPDSCPCGPDCECGPECPCPATGKESLQVPQPAGGPVREIAILSAAWCGPCQALHAKHSKTPNVRFVDIEREPVETARLWNGCGIAGYASPADGRPGAVPVFVLVENGEPVMRWGPESKPDLRAMLAHGLSSGAAEQPSSRSTASSAYVKVSAGRSLGSGVVVGDGLVLTAAHVVYAGWPHAIDVDGTRYAAEVIGHDEKTDLALVECDTLPAIEPVSLASVAPGNWATVTSHGFPAGGRRLDRTSRIAVGPTVGMYEVYGGFRQGESGGAVLSGGALVGIVSGTDGRMGLAVDHPSLVAFLKRYGVTP